MGHRWVIVAVCLLVVFVDGSAVHDGRQETSFRRTTRASSKSRCACLRALRWRARTSPVSNSSRTAALPGVHDMLTDGRRRPAEAGGSRIHPGRTGGPERARARPERDHADGSRKLKKYKELTIGVQPPAHDPGRRLDRRVPVLPAGTGPGAARQIRAAGSRSGCAKFPASPISTVRTKQESPNCA